MRLHNVDGDSKRMGIDKGKIVPRVEEDVGGGREGQRRRADGCIAIGNGGRALARTGISLTRGTQSGM